MVNIPNFSIDPTKERGDMERQARQLIEDLRGFIQGSESARITRLSVNMFQQALARYERDFEAEPGEEANHGENR